MSWILGREDMYPKNNCKHRMIEREGGKLVINTMSDYVPVNFCPICGEELFYEDIEKQRGEYD